MKFFTLLVLAVVLFTCLGTQVEVAEGRSDALLKLLDEMIDKMDKFQKDQAARLKKLSAAHKNDVKVSDKELSRLRAAYEKERDHNEVLKDEQKKEANEGAAAMLKLRQTYEKETRLIRKIRAMLKHEVGTNKAHAAESCSQIFMDLTAPSGTYWIVENGKPTQKRCVRAGSNVVQWTGGCSTSDRGKGGWANLCLDAEESNSAQGFLKRHSTHLQVIQPGLYSLKGIVQTYCSGRCSRNSRILINGNSINYHHSNALYKTTTEFNDVTWPLKKNDRISFSVYGAGSDIWRWKSKKEGEARNRFSAQYLGKSSDEVFFSAGCSGSKRSSGWQRLCLNKVEQNSALTKQHLDHYKDGRVIIKKDGYYRINADAMMHTNGGQHYIRTVINGANRQYAYSYSNGWRTVTNDLTFPLKADDTLEIYTHASGGNPYNWHAHSLRGHTARLQIYRVSDLTGDQRVKMIQGGPSSHHRGSGWFQYRLNRLQVNTMPSSVISYKSNGDLRVKTTTWVRINAVAQTHLNGRPPRYGKITVNGATVATTTYEHEHSWQNMQMDHTFPAVKGDVIRVFWRAKGGNPYVHVFSSPSGEGMLEVYAF